MADEVQKIKEKLDIVDFISEYSQLKRAGRNFKALCPFHQEKNPSFFVSPERQVWKCFGCFPPGSLVKTERGLCPIEDIKIGEKVFTHKGNLKKVLLTFRRKYEGNLVKTRLRKFGETVALTEDHKVLALKGAPYLHKEYKNLSKRLRMNKKMFERKEFLRRFSKYFSIEKVKAGELKKGDYLLYPIVEKVEDIPELDLRKFLNKRPPVHGAQPREINYKVKVDEKFLKLLGYYIAEGSSNRAYIRFSLGLNEENLAYEIGDILKELWGLDIGVHRRKRKSGSGLEITCCHSFLASIFKNLCGVGSQEKHIPFELQFLPPKKQRVLLEAIKRGDGSSYRSNKGEKRFLNITTTSPVLKDQIRDILLRLGYFPTIAINEAHIDKNGVNHKTAYTSSWSDEAESRYRLTVRLKDDSLFWVLPIYELSKEKHKGEVYNLNVSTDHTFITDGFAVGNCGRGGDIFTFLMEKESLSFPEALEILAQRAGIKLSRGYSPEKDQEKQRLLNLLDLVSRFYRYLLARHKLGAKVRDYLTKRGITEETRKKFQLGYAPNSWDATGKFLLKRGFDLENLLKAGLVIKKEKGRGWYDRFRGRLMFPVKDHLGRVMGFSARTLNGQEPKYINSPDTLVFHKRKLLYGLDRAKEAIREKDKVVLVEGNLDVISGHQAGFFNLVAPLGGGLTLDQVNLIKRFTKNLTLCFDADESGKRSTLRGIELAHPQGMGLRVVKIKGGKDPDEVIQKEPKLFEKLLKEEVSAFDFLVTEARDLYDLKTPEGKGELSKFVFPFVKSTPDEIVKSAYVKKLSEALGVEEKAIREDLEKFKIFKPSLEKEGVPPEVARDRQQILEEHFLALALSAPNILWSDAQFEDILKQVSEDYFADLVRREVWVKFLKLYQKTHQVEPETIAPGLSEEAKEILDLLLLTDVGTISEEEEEFLTVLESALRELKLAYLKRELGELSRQIKQAEESGEEDKIRKLKKDFCEKSQELTKVNRL